MMRQNPSTELLLLWKSFFFLRNFFMLAIAVAISLALRLSLRWHQMAMERNKSEMDRQAAELKNLKNQISPHFLLNTLNNIYALTTFDTEKAGQAIHELSKLLRYLLYENQAELVDLEKEADFLHNYIELMRLRIGKNVDLQVDLNVPQHSEVSIAPLLFISLVENAFKHGICPTQPSFIHIRLNVKDDGEITFTCTNSNFPKSADDKSGGGIGLQQVSQRLELSYPHRHTWQKGVKDGAYTSCITLKGE
jgi:LytS/YehU family sensor histidine kinase